jgi:hypothetical protein
MKTYQNTAYLILFFVSLLSGILVGRRIGVRADDSTNAPLRQKLKPSLLLKKELRKNLTEADQLTDNSSPVMVSHQQRNILIVGVDDLGEPSPTLSSIWLIIYLQDSPHLMLLPIYPIGETHPDGTLIDKLDDDFRLTPQRSLHSDFITALEEKEIWWTGHIIIDKYALADVVDFIAEANANPFLGGVNAITSIPIARDAPYKSVIGQADLIKNLCQNTTGLSSIPRWQYLHLFAMTQDHFSTDYVAEEALDEWLHLLSEGGGISCEFPSMALPNTHP